MRSSEVSSSAIFGSFFCILTGLGLFCSNLHPKRLWRRCSRCSGEMEKREKRASGKGSRRDPPMPRSILKKDTPLPPGSPRVRRKPKKVCFLECACAQLGRKRCGTKWKCGMKALTHWGKQSGFHCEEDGTRKKWSVEKWPKVEALKKPEVCPKAPRSSPSLSNLCYFGRDGLLYPLRALEFQDSLPAQTFFNTDGHLCCPPPPDSQPPQENANDLCPFCQWSNEERWRRPGRPDSSSSESPPPSPKPPVFSFSDCSIDSNSEPQPWRVEEPPANKKSSRGSRRLCPLGQCLRELWNALKEWWRRPGCFF